MDTRAFANEETTQIRHPYIPAEGFLDSYYASAAAFAFAFGSTTFAMDPVAMWRSGFVAALHTAMPALMAFAAAVFMVDDWLNLRVLLARYPYLLNSRVSIARLWIDIIIPSLGFGLILACPAPAAYTIVFALLLFLACVWVLLVKKEYLHNMADDHRLEKILWSHGIPAIGLMFSGGVMLTCEFFTSAEGLAELRRTEYLFAFPGSLVSLIVYKASTRGHARR